VNTGETGIKSGRFYSGTLAKTFHHGGAESRRRAKEKGEASGISIQSGNRKTGISILRSRKERRARKEL
jgi:hypothetical protein